MNSGWRKKWREECRRVLYAMTGRELATFSAGDWSAGRGGRAFMDVAHRLDLDIAYSTYVMEQAELESANILAAA